MRNILVATLALAPVLVHAQALPPAQPGAQAPVLESKLVSPKTTDNAPSPNVIAPTTSLLQPKLVKWGNVEMDSHQWEDALHNRVRAVTVSMIVTEQGLPTHLKVIASDDPTLNHSVLDAVAHYRFTPASLDSKPTAMPVLLTVRVVPRPN